MNGELPSGPAAFAQLDWPRAMLLLMVPVGWCMGFLFGLGCGSGAAEAAMTASACALSVLVGCAVYLLFWTSIRSNVFGIIQALLFGGMTVVRRTRDPWPFTSRLAFGVVATVIFVVVIECLTRLVILLSRRSQTTGEGS